MNQLLVVIFFIKFWLDCIHTTRKDLATAVAERAAERKAGRADNILNILANITVSL